MPKQPFSDPALHLPDVTDQQPDAGRHAVGNRANVLAESATSHELNTDTLANNAKKSRTATKRRSFKGLSLEERQNERREKLIEAGLQVYGTQGFFSVTVRDVCNEAKLTERYFYESFKRSEELFRTIFLRLVEQLQQSILAGVMQTKAEPRLMIEAGLKALFDFMRNDPRMARILYIDAILVQEMQGSTIYESMARFDRMIQAILLLVLPKKPAQDLSLSLVATGLNGYVTQIAIRWVMGGFSEPQEQILNSCKMAYLSIIEGLERNTDSKSAGSLSGKSATAHPL